MEETIIEWDKYTDEIEAVFGKCSNCGDECVIKGSNFCPNCGRKITNPLTNL